MALCRIGGQSPCRRGPAGHLALSHPAPVRPSGRQCHRCHRSRPRPRASCQGNPIWECEPLASRKHEHAAMIRNLHDMEKFSILATDGEIGHAEEGLLLRRRVVGHSLPDRGGRFLARQQDGADLAHRHPQAQVDRTGPAGPDDEGEGQTEPRHRHRSARISAEPDAVPRLLWLSLLLGAVLGCGAAACIPTR